jgi:hypothetical protein
MTKSQSYRETFQERLVSLHLLYFQDVALFLLIGVFDEIVGSQNSIAGISMS